MVTGLSHFGAHHKLLKNLRRNVKAFFLLDFLSHAARMMMRDEEERHHGVRRFFVDRCLDTSSRLALLGPPGGGHRDPRMF